MRYHEILSEKIVNAPYKLGPYVDARIRELKQLQSQLKAASDKLRATPEEAQRDLDYCFRKVDPDLSSIVDELAYVSRPNEDGVSSLERTLQVDYLIDNLTAYKTYGKDFVRYVLSTIDHIEPPHGVQMAVGALGAIDGSVAEYGFRADSEDDRPVFVALDAVKSLLGAIQGYLGVAGSMKEKLGEVQRKSSAWHEKDLRPDHDEVEVLYHATAYAREIVADGFSAEPPVDRVGLGNLGTQNGISFTHSLEVAHTIARYLKEVWMIAHGQLDARTIIKWIKQEGLDKAHPDLASTIGLSRTVDEHPVFGKRYELKTLDDIARDNTPEDALEVFRVYLWLQTMRSNPVGVGMKELFAMMKGRALSDIGVLKCEVRLSKDDEYMHGESEFRVPADRVLTIKRMF